MWVLFMSFFMMSLGLFLKRFRLETKNATRPIGKIHIVAKFQGFLASPAFLKRWTRRFGTEILADSSLIINKIEK
jgi:hypothetical protein